MSQKKRNATFGELLNIDLGRNDRDVLHLYQRLLQGLDTPVALSCYIMVENGEFNQLLCKEINPLHYEDGDLFLRDNQAVKFLQKYIFQFDVGLDPEQAALNTLTEGESACLESNRRLRKGCFGTLGNKSIDEEIVREAQSIIDSILGPFDVQEWVSCCRFGPGTTAFSDVAVPDLIDKLTRTPTVTSEFAPFALALLSEYPGWITGLTNGRNTVPEIRVVQGGKHSCVPKSAKTHRNIETQPTLNLWAQLGLGHMIRERLRISGLDLTKRADVHRSRMAYASRTGEIGTIDLSNASDTISRELVRLLLPHEWLTALTICRTTKMYLKGSWVELQRFSAMGNGFTFELETLIFYALCLASAKQRRRRFVSAFGDDILVHRDDYDKVVQVLEWAGFTVNPKKSYNTGYFRESCGADFFQGKVVRAFQLKRRLTNVPSIISLANGLARAACRSNRGYGFDRRYRAAWLCCIRWIPYALRRKIAFGLPDDDSFIFAQRFRGNRFIVATVLRKPITSFYSAVGAALYRQYQRGIGKDVQQPVVYTATKTILTRDRDGPYKLQPGSPAKLALDWGVQHLLGCDVLVPECGWA